MKILWYILIIVFVFCVVALLLAFTAWSVAKLVNAIVEIWGEIKDGMH